MPSPAPLFAVEDEAPPCRPARYWGATLFLAAAGAWLATIAAAKLLVQLI